MVFVGAFVVGEAAFVGAMVGLPVIGVLVGRLEGLAVVGAFVRATDAGGHVSTAQKEGPSEEEGVV